MSKTNTLTLKTALTQLKSGDLSHETLYEDLKTAIAQKNSQLNIYLTLNDQMLAQAKDRAHTGTLLGAPIAVKDNFCTKNLRTTASAKVLENFLPQYESTVTKNLQAAGGVISGKTNMDAWAHGSSTETSDFGRTLNPRNTDYLPGGSSGGSAAAVAADLCLAAIGSETAGSIRQPAAWCGVVGLKPTYGRVSRHGVVAMASSTDSPGPIAKTVEDACLILNTIAGPDAHNATCNRAPAPDFTSFLGQSLKGLKVGVIYHDLAGMEDTNAKLIQQLEVLKAAGAKVELAQAMDPHYAIGVYTVVSRSEISSNLARFDGIRYGQGRDIFAAEAKRRIMLGTFSLSKGYSEKYYDLAQKVRTLFIEDFNQLFQKYDVLISATNPGFAKKIGATEGQAMFGDLEDMLVEASSVSGLPGISVPYFHDEKTGLYLGMNITAPMWREDLTIKVADAFEKNSPWNSWRTPHVT